MSDLAKTIDDAFEARNDVSPATKGAVREAVETALDLLDKGEARVAEKKSDGKWQVNQWLKKAVLLSFRLNDMGPIAGAAGGATWWDKVPSKFDGWGENRFRAAGFRAVPGSIVRRSAYIAPNVVLMPSFVNLGAYVDTGTMVDTWATVGSCAQIGKNVHISGGAGIGGVLEPLQAGPGHHRGQLLRRRALGSRRRRDRARGLGALDGRVHRRLDQDRRSRETGEIFMGEVPAYSVVVPGSHARQADEERRARPEPLLRGDRQARGREDALQDEHQRVACETRRGRRAHVESVLNRARLLRD